MARRVLVIPKSFFGDIILTSPVFEALKRSDPDTHVAVVAPPQLVDFINRDTYVDEVIPFDRRKALSGWKGLRLFADQLRTRAFDTVYVLQRSPRVALLVWLAKIPKRVGLLDSFLAPLFTRRVRVTPRHHEVVRSLEVVVGDLNSDVREEIENLTKSGPAPVSNLFSLRVPDVSIDEISAPLAGFLAQIPSQGYVILAPGSAWETKRWRADGFREVATALVKQGYAVVIVGAPDDSAACAEVCRDQQVPEGMLTNMCGRTSLFELIYLIRGSRGVICNDSLALHLASATKVPTVAVFCATSPLFGFGPWKNRALVVEKSGLFCKPCRRHGSRTCPTGTNACMKEVTSEQVLQAFSDVTLDEAKRKTGGSLHIV